MASVLTTYRDCFATIPYTTQFNSSLHSTYIVLGIGGNLEIVSTQQEGCGLCANTAVLGKRLEHLQLLVSIGGSWNQSQGRRGAMYCSILMQTEPCCLKKSCLGCLPVRRHLARCWLLTPVILPTQEAEIRRITVQSQPGKIV
jgi:hypothetical protein